MKTRKPKINFPSKYWTSSVDDAIGLFCKNEDMDQRNTIYNEKIHYALTKLIECIFNTFNFQYINDSVENIKADCLSHCYLQLHKFDPSRNYKGFSYFSTIAKNYFIALNNKRYAALKVMTPLTREDEGGYDEDIMLDNIIPETNESENTDLTSQQMELVNKVIEYYQDGSSKMISDSDRKILDRLVYLLNNGNEVFNKSGGRYPIWEIISKGVCPKNSCRNKLRKIFKLAFPRMKIGSPTRKYIYPEPVTTKVKRIYHRKDRVSGKLIKTATRKCPKCQKDIIYTGVNAIYNSTYRENLLCRECARLERIGVRYKQ